MNDITAVETTTGECLFVELDETAKTIIFRDEDDATVAAYGFSAFASLTDALALNIGAGIVIDADVVAGVQQWARI
jgi:hypothetical protein